MFCLSVGGGKYILTKNTLVSEITNALDSKPEKRLRGYLNVVK